MTTWPEYCFLFPFPPPRSDNRPFAPDPPIRLPFPVRALQVRRPGNTSCLMNPSIRFKPTRSLLLPPHTWFRILFVPSSAFRVSRTKYLARETPSVAARACPCIAPSSNANNTIHYSVSRARVVAYSGGQGQLSPNRSTIGLVLLFIHSILQRILVAHPTLCCSFHPVHFCARLSNVDHAVGMRILSVA